MDESKPSKKFGIVVGYVLLFAAAFWLLFYHLDNHLLWGDEAETAVLAKNVVQFGVPRTYDGTNYLILHGNVDETPGHVWIWSPWMQNYLAASSFMLFGPTTWAARAPFALIGWCSLPLLALAAWRIYRSHWVTLASVALLAASEIFLLHARQCRYYSISVFAEILFVYGACELLAARRRGVWLAALALVLQFYSNYIIAAANLPALICLAWILRRQGHAAILRVALVFGVFIAAVLPWLAYAHPWGQGNAMGHENYFGKAFGYLLQIHFLFVPLCFLLLPLLRFFSKGRGVKLPDVAKQWEYFLLFLMAGYFVVILLAPGFYLRYQLPLLPLLCLLAAAWALRYIRWRALAVALIIVQVASNALSIASGFPFRHGRVLRFPVVEYVSGISAPYTNRLADIVDFFETHAQPGQRVLSFDPEFPLIFYTGLGVIDGRIMEPPSELPDWVLPVSASGDVTREPAALPELQPRYTLITIFVHDSSMFNSIPEPDVYQFHTMAARVPFQIYQLNANTNEPAK
jgi:4-amino-4-deoxy-L-arabinose transferase-like glycosyltransferase